MKARLTLRFVIGVVCATIVLVVAVITLAITYTVSLSTVRDVGKSYARALAMTGRVQTENFFETPVLHGQNMAHMFHMNEFDNPDPMSPDIRAHNKYWNMHYNYHETSNFTYSQSGIIFDDGGGHNSFYSPSDRLILVSRFATNWQMQGFAFNMTTMMQVPYNPVEEGYKANYDVRFQAYYVAKQLSGTSRNGMWYPVSVYAPTATAQFFLPMAMPLYNRSNGFVGLGTVGAPIAIIAQLLRGIKSTPNTEAFAVEGSGFLLGGSYKVPTFTVTYSTNTNPTLASGCGTSAATDFVAKNYTWIGCRFAAASFSAYPPLQILATDHPDFLSASGTNVMEAVLAGDNYFVVSTEVHNTFRFWALHIVLIMPESDIIGDIVAGRNTAIGITAGVCIVAAFFSFTLVFLLLQPLTAMSKKMLDTAKLKDIDEDSEYSRLGEIQDLQKAYTNMNTAIKSFTRYVPRDVVKDLMSTGQLCEISMTPQRCTMLFVDIAGFTTVCERVPPDVLSGLVSQYFDRASRIVMDHDGLIDKFIGDCIMAVWGAPFAVSNQEVKAVLTGKLLDRETIVEPLASSWDEAGEQLRVRVGISTGEVLAGNMGSAERMNYTVIGDPVNLSARLESMNKQFGTRVMVSEMTAEGLGNVFVLRLLLPIAVVGKDLPVKVYEVMGLNRTIDPLDIERMQAGDEAYTRKAKEGSDSNSNSDARSVASSIGVTRLSKRSTIAMVRDAALKTSQDVSITVTEDEMHFAQMHTQAVLQYLRKDFKGATNSFRSLRAATPGRLLSAELATGGASHPMRSCYADKSITIVEKLCEEYSVRCPDDFDGVYKALEK